MMFLVSSSERKLISNIIIIEDISVVGIDNLLLQRGILLEHKLRLQIISKKVILSSANSIQCSIPLLRILVGITFRKESNHLTFQNLKRL